MKEGIPDFPEVAEGINMEEDKGLAEDLRGKLLDALDPVLHHFFDTKEILREFRGLQEAHEEAKKLSAEAGEFFKSLIPDGLRKPEVEGAPNAGSHNYIMMLEFLEADKLLADEVRKLSRKEYKEKKKHVLAGSLHGRERLASKGKVKEHERTNGVVDQTVTNVLAQDGSKNLIFEGVHNTLDRPKKHNDTYAYLVIQDVATGATLDLNALLPAGFKYVPKSIDVALYQPDAESITGGIYKQKEVAGLKDYDMDRSTSRDFAERPFHGIVDYGDLRKIGGVLSLLHEVAHAWQSRYYRAQSKGEFESTHAEVFALVMKLGIPEDSDQYENPEKIWDKLEKIGVECLDRNGTQTPTDEEGVLNIPNIYYEMTRLIRTSGGLSELQISQSVREEVQSRLTEFESKIRFYPIKSELLQNKMNNYIAEERDAWAHAIRTVRFLRRKGIDVEPELKKLEDIKGVIDPCLESYQKNLDRSIMSQLTDYRFVKAPK